MEEKQFLYDISEFKPGKCIYGFAFNNVVVAHDDKTNKDYIVDSIFYLPETDEEIKLNHTLEKFHQNPHPNLKEILGYSLDRNYVKLISNFQTDLTITSLLKSLQKKKTFEGFDDTTRFTIIAGIARGMMHFYEHEIGFVQIRPYNIFLDDNFNPKILPEFDLVLNASIQHLEMPAARLNETTYCPVCDDELFEDFATTEKADVYSFAMIAYELINGFRPFSNDRKIQSILDIKERMINKAYPVFTKPIPSSLQSLLESCWSQNVEDRLSFKEIFNYFANEFVNDQSIENFDSEKYNNYIKSIL